MTFLPSNNLGAIWSSQNGSQKSSQSLSYRYFSLNIELTTWTSFRQNNGTKRYEKEL
ncbi:hypothetical protein FD46_GL000774 [Liquorilactobacillus oeni DSM 19972]|uniref:Uncharacterized protein n=1 Tax=Liquorilactobacillus oeni DSM 19972 TaxID=1423777 RepID=A0A0R1MLG5_9LACO|nr:hypothetical protein FD46_GL000774 [Liquorilactobacillus oeni DSM 19972]